MKLVNISKSDEKYIIKALITYKVLGISLFSSVKSYAYNEEKDWYELKTGKTPSKSKILKLDKWLKDHQKFIEKADS